MSRRHKPTCSSADRLMWHRLLSPCIIQIGYLKRTLTSCMSHAQALPSAEAKKNPQNPVVFQAGAAFVHQTLAVISWASLPLKVRWSPFKASQMRPVLMNIQRRSCTYGDLSVGMLGGKKKKKVIKQEPVNIRKHFFIRRINLPGTKTSLLSLKGHKLARGGR